jgi:hypothetical protein
MRLPIGRPGEDWRIKSDPWSSCELGLDRCSPPRPSPRPSSVARRWVAIGCFVLLSLAVLVMLWPRRDWSFSLAPAEFIGTYLERADGEAVELHLIERDLALHMGRSIRFNSAQLNRLAGVFRCGAVLLLIEVLAWVVALVAVG